MSRAAERIGTVMIVVDKVTLGSGEFEIRAVLT